VQKNPLIQTVSFLAHDISVKFKILEDASNRGCPVAQFHLASHFIDTSGDPKRIFQLFMSSARTGLRESQLNLSISLQYGCGCDVNLTESLKWLSRSAIGGDPHAQARLCEFYRRVAKNKEKAFHYASKSYEKSLMGLYEMGMCWMEKPDVDGKTKAIDCLKKAAGSGYTMAMLTLGNYYYALAEGGAVQEYGPAFRWIKKTAEHIEESKFLCLMFQ
jgi:TPR repeat protein